MTVYVGENFFRDPDFAFFIDRYTIVAGERIPSHTHDFVEFVFVVSGSAVHDMSGHRYEIRAGDVFVLEPDVYHSYTGSPGEDTVVFNVLFDPAFLEREMDALLQMPSFVHFFYFLPFIRKSGASFLPYQSLKPEEQANLESHLGMILEEYRACREGYQLLIKTRWIECLIWLSRYLGIEQKRKEPAVSDSEWIRSVRHFIEQHYKQNLTLKQFSQISGMSVSSLTAKFKRATGMSLFDYKHGVQIREACLLLADTDRKVLDVAHETGFHDISFFNKIFRKHVGVTPRQYRTGIRKPQG